MFRRFLFLGESLQGIEGKIDKRVLIILLVFILSLSVGLLSCKKNEREKTFVSEDIKEEVLVRNPKFADAFYPGNPAQLKSMLESMFNKADVVSDENVAGIVVPHAGYMYSGLTAAYAFKSVGYKPDSVIIIGPSHRMPVSGAVLYPEGVWKTPLGDMKVDEKLNEEMMKASDYFHTDISPHEIEHSIEVQLPFIQYLWGDIAFVPVVVWRGDEKSAREMGDALVEAIKEDGRKILVVATADLSHYHPLTVADKLDHEAIRALESGDPMEIIRADNSGATEVDCAFALAAVGYYAQAVGAVNTEVLKWTTSAEASGDTSQVVGYMAMKWSK